MFHLAPFSRRNRQTAARQAVVTMERSYGDHIYTLPVATAHLHEAGRATLVAISNNKSTSLPHRIFSISVVYGSAFRNSGAAPDSAV